MCDVARLDLRGMTERRMEERVGIPEVLAPERERHLEATLRREAARHGRGDERAGARSGRRSELDARALELAREPEVREEPEEAAVEDEGGRHLRSP